MRREDKEIVSLGMIEEIIEKATICHVAFSDGNQPYVIPLCYGYADGAFFVHCANEGKKLEMLRTNSSVCVSCEADLAFIEDKKPCNWGMRYKSIIAFGNASLVLDEAAKQHALAIIMKHYAHEEYTQFDSRLDRITIIRIDVTSITGKQSG